jgi:hypothetical protein
VVTRLIVGVVLVDGHGMLLWWVGFQCHFDAPVVSDLVVKVLINYRISYGDAPCIDLV